VLGVRRLANTSTAPASLAGVRTVRGDSGLPVLIDLPIAFSFPRPDRRVRTLSRTSVPERIPVSDFGPILRLE